MSSNSSDTFSGSELEKLELEIEEEAARIAKIREEMLRKIGEPKTDKEEMDARSVYVGNVDYGVTTTGLQSHFEACGHINRVSIQVNKFTKQPKGFAYIEFRDKEGMEAALELTDSLLAGRQIKVVAKRTNKPGIGGAAARGARGGARGASGTRGASGARGGAGTRGGAHRGAVIVKYVYVNGPAPSGRGSARGRRGGYRSFPY